MAPANVLHQSPAAHAFAELGCDVRTSRSIEELIAQTLQLSRRFIAHVGDIAELFDATIQVCLDLIEHRT
ncbi:MAG TPA: hypothetical protein VFU01_03435 [Gemmatimonadaceae bacterium]|nr:hypothetical protein [Gemmatimonadaceae bacterium]